MKKVKTSQTNKPNRIIPSKIKELPKEERKIIIKKWVNERGDSMSKQIGLFLGVITGVVMLILLAFGACYRYLKEITTDDYLPGLIEKNLIIPSPAVIRLNVAYIFTRTQKN